MAIPVGVYTRISDAEEGDTLGVSRQRQDCCDLVGIRRWRMGRVYEDNDFSAYQRKVVRPDFEQMLTDLRAGAIKGVVVYDLDRLVRQPRDLERLIEIYDDHPEYVFTSLQGDINLTSSDGRTMARVLVAFANKSSSDTSRRVKRKQQELAESGKPHGGRPAFGWLPDGLTADEDAKKEILAGQKRVLAGDKISAIQLDWAERGVAPLNRKGERYSDAPVRHKNVKHILTNPALAGFKVYKGEIVTGPDGEPITAAWDILCSPERLEAVRTALEERRLPTRGGQGVTKYLLSGIARCGVCSKGMRGGVKGGSYYYACANFEPGQRCGKVRRVGPPVDDLVIDLVLLDRHRKRSAPAAGVAPWPGEAELGQVQSDIAELVEARKAGKISVAVMIELLPDLEARRDTLLFERRRAAADRLRKETALEADAETREDFLDRPLDRQRALVLQSLKGVIIHPSGRTGRGFNPDLIQTLPAD